MRKSKDIKIKSYYVIEFEKSKPFSEFSRIRECLSFNEAIKLARDAKNRAGLFDIGVKILGEIPYEEI